jgi:hypothetical protein
MMWIRYALLLLILPCYIVALQRRRWATIPLWLVSTSAMLMQYMLSVHQSAGLGDGAVPATFVYVGEMTKIMLIPIAVQIAVGLNGMRIGAGERANRGLRKFTETLDAS